MDADCIALAREIYLEAGFTIADLIGDIEANTERSTMSSMAAAEGLHQSLKALLCPTKDIHRCLLVLGVSVCNRSGRLKSRQEIRDEFDRGLQGLSKGARRRALDTIFGPNCPPYLPFISGE